MSNQNINIDVRHVTRVVSEISMPMAASVAFSEVRVWPMEQIPQIREVIVATSL